MTMYTGVTFFVDTVYYWTWMCTKCPVLAEICALRVPLLLVRYGVRISTKFGLYLQQWMLNSLR